MWLILLFALCFLCVHVARLVKFGWLYQNKDAPPAKPQEKPPQQQKNEESKPAASPSSEPVYYIVERKRKTRSSYSEPKRIDFK